MLWLITTLRVSENTKRRLRRISLLQSQALLSLPWIILTLVHLSIKQSQWIMELKFSTERESQKKVKTARPDPPRQEAPREDKAIAGLARTPQLSSLFQPSEQCTQWNLESTKKRFIYRTFWFSTQVRDKSPLLYQKLQDLKIVFQITS